MQIKRYGRLFLVGLFVSMALLVVVGCERAPTPTTTLITAPPVRTPPPVSTTAPPVVTPTRPSPTAPPTAPVVKPTTPAPPKGITLEIREPADESILTSSPVRVSGVTALDAVVSVNGAVVPVEDGGAFSADVDLLEGPNLVEITASDLEGNTATRAIAVIYLP